MTYEYAVGQKSVDTHQRCFSHIDSASLFFFYSFFLPTLYSMHGWFHLFITPLASIKGHK